MMNPGNNAVVVGSKFPNILFVRGLSVVFVVMSASGILDRCHAMPNGPRTPCRCFS